MYRPLETTPVRYRNVQSAAIDLLRFPLAVLVVIDHACPWTVAIPEASFPLLSATGLLNVFFILCSNVIGNLAVPCFFLISGFLFFRSMPGFDFRAWRARMKRRILHRMVPYMLWNLLPFAFCLLYGVLGFLRSGLPDSIPEDLRHADLYRILWEWGTWGGSVHNIFGIPICNSGPYNAPLWFMRDLFVMMFLSPVIYLIVRYLRLWGLALIFLCMDLHLSPDVPGLSAYAAFYFGAGAWFAVHKQSILAYALRMRSVLYTAIGPLLIGAVYFNCETTPEGIWIYPLFQLAGVFILFIIAARAVRKGFRPVRTLVSASFFVYAFHAVGLFPYRGSNLAIISRSLAGIFGYSPAGVFITYILSVILTVGICLGLYALLRRYLPRTARILTGR